MKFRNDTRGEMTVKKVLTVVIAALVGLILLPVVQDGVTTGQEFQNNSTDASTSSLLGMITLFYILFVVLGVVLWVVYETKKE